MSNTTGWQPIETAPKDGKDILLCAIRRPVRLCFWDTARGGLWSMWPGREPYELPTHWMPLPDPPEAS